MSTGRGMDKDGVVHIYNGISLGPFAATRTDPESVTLVKSVRQRSRAFEWHPFYVD